MQIKQWYGVAAVALVAVAVLAFTGMPWEAVAGGLVLANGPLLLPIEDRVAELKKSLLDLSDRTQAIQATAAAAKRDLTPDEHKTITDLADEFDRVEQELQVAERTLQMQARAGAGTGRRTDPNPVGSPQNSAGRQPDGLQNTVLRTQAERDRWGFTNLGEFARSVVDMGRGRQDPRIIQNAALSTYSSEGIGADGGVAVPPAFRSEIQSVVLGEDSILGQCDSSPTNSNMVIVPTDEDTVWGASGGVRVYRRAEAAAMTQSKLALKDITVRIEEMYALVPVTDQLLQDAPMLSNFLTTKAGQKMDFKITDEIINGTGSQGQMLGILNSPCLVTVTKETSQAAGTIVGANILKMYSRMPDRVRRSAVWLINQDVEEQLLSISLAFRNRAGADVAAGVSGLVGEGGLRFDPTAGTLMGRPIISTEACQTIGTAGDIILAYLPGYFAPYGAGGVRNDMSMHLWFDQGVTAFRWTFRVGGQPWLSGPISRKNGSNTLSHFVALQTR
jgi:HK97 family phage major capsid protein